VSKLEFYARPLIAFDATNKQHRRWYHEFVTSGGWGRCPVRFIVPESTGSDLVKIITNSLIEYYVGKEFVVKKPHKLIRQKRQKKVDN
jgi:hypothetical protein